MKKKKKNSLKNLIIFYNLLIEYIKNWKLTLRLDEKAK